MIVVKSFLTSSTPSPNLADVSAKSISYCYARRTPSSKVTERCALRSVLLPTSISTIYCEQLAFRSSSHVTTLENEDRLYR
jgi:hypothetical protein